MIPKPLPEVSQVPPPQATLGGAGEASKIAALQSSLTTAPKLNWMPMMRVNITRVWVKYRSMSISFCYVNIRSFLVCLYFRGGLETTYKLEYYIIV
jgi:hypothetical protein